MSAKKRESSKKTVAVAIDVQTRRTLAKASHAVSELAGAWISVSDNAPPQNRS